MTDPNAYIAAIASIIAAIAAIISPIIVALVNNHHQYKIKTIDLFFNAKLTAYQNLLKVTSSFSDTTSKEESIKLNDVMSYALLLSSPETQVCIGSYCHSILQNTPSDKSGELQAIAILAMQKDLYEFKKYRKLYKQKTHTKL